MKRVANPTTLAEKTLKAYMRTATYAAVDDRRKMRENDGKYDRATAIYESYGNITADKTTRIADKKEWIKYNTRQVQIIRQIMEGYIADLNAADIPVGATREQIMNALDDCDSAYIYIVANDFRPSGVLASYHDNQRLSSLITNKMPKYVSQISLSAILAEYFTNFLKHLAYTIVMFCWDEVHVCSCDGVFGPLLLTLGVRTNILDVYEDGIRPSVPKKKKESPAQ